MLGPVLDTDIDDKTHLCRFMKNSSACCVYIHASVFTAGPGTRSSAGTHLDDIKVGCTSAAHVDGDRIHQRALGKCLDFHWHCGAEHQRLALPLEVRHHLRRIAIAGLAGRKLHYLSQEEGLDARRAQALFHVCVGRATQGSISVMHRQSSVEQAIQNVPLRPPPLNHMGHEAMHREDGCLCGSP